MNRKPSKSQHGTSSRASQARRFAFAAAGILILYAAGVSGFLAWNLRRALDRRLLADLAACRSLRFQPDGALRPAGEIDPEALVEVRAPDGDILYRSPSLGERVVAGPPFAGEGQDDESLRSDRLHDGERIRVASRRMTIEGRTVLVRAARGERAPRREWKDVSTALLWVLPPALILAVLAGYRLARATDVIN